MSIEKLFLQKAVKDKNYVSFSYENKKYEKVKALEFSNDILKSDKEKFDFSKIKKLTVLKERF